MSAFVDTNILVRHLTGDPPAQAAWATKILATSDELLLADLVVAEVVYVLKSFYQVPRERLAELVRSISAHHCCGGRMTGRPALLLRPSPMD